MFKMCFRLQKPQNGRCIYTILSRDYFSPFTISENLKIYVNNISKNIAHRDITFLIINNICSSIFSLNLVLKDEAWKMYEIVRMVRLHSLFVPLFIGSISSIFLVGVFSPLYLRAQPLWSQSKPLFC